MDEYADSITPETPHAEAAAALFALLSDATRVRILLAIGDDELSVNHLADIVDRSPSAVSQHLSRLRLGGLVIARNDGNRVFYRLANEHPLELVSAAILQSEHLGGRPSHHHSGGESRRS